MNRRHAIHAGAAAGLSLWLAGCATATRERAASSFSGRLALRIETEPVQAFSAGFDLIGDAATGSLTLSSPLGQTLAVVRWSPVQAELQRGEERTRRGTLDELTTELAGTALPVTALFDWLAGRATAAAGWRVDLSRHAEGRLSAERTEPAPRAELRLILAP